MSRIRSVLAGAGLFLSTGLAAAQVGPCNEPNSIAKVRNRAPAGPYEYVVFDYVKPPTLPQLTIRRARPPFIEDGSGNTITVRGSKFTEVRFDGVFWTCIIKQSISVPKRGVKDVKRTGQFEAIVSFVIGIGRASQFAGSYSYDAGPRIRKIVVRVRK